jgi:rhodanese-related sulfurtransferase
MKQLAPRDLRDWLADPGRPRPALLDVREPWEYDICHIDGAQLVPMRQVPARLDALDRTAETVVICHHGIRSYQIARVLEREGFSAVYNLTGGVEAWARDVDATMPTY